MSALTDMLMRHEAVKLFPYRDIVGKLTIGCGRNLDDNGISHDEAMLLLQNDVQNVLSQLRLFPWFRLLDPVRQDALTDMCFNMGITRFMGFHKMIDALVNGDTHNASVEMLNSTWAQEVPKRATELSAMMDTGQYQA